MERHDGAMRPSPHGGDLFDGDAALPQGLVYRPELIGEDEERALLQEVAALPLHEARYKEYTARRRIVSYGSSYDFSANVLHAEAPIPAFLLPLRERIAAWVRLPPARFGQALVTEYRPGTSLGWHRDVPQFGIIVGVSLGTACRMRFRPYPPVAHRRGDVFVLDLAPRSAYVLRGDIRWRWQHSIPPTPALRHSITFRTGVGPREGSVRHVNALADERGVWLRALGIWALMMLAESVHGILRGLYLAPALGDRAARQVGVLIGSLLVLFIAWLFAATLRRATPRGRLAIGLAWVALTLAFEVILGRLVLGYGWDSLLEDYDIAHGGLMPLGLFVLALAPQIAVRLRAPRHGPVTKPAPSATGARHDHL